jgi:hypothetical protein
MGKPVVLEEFGLQSQRMFPQDVSDNMLSDWIQSYKDQLDSAFHAGVSGAMFWGWGVPDTKKVLQTWMLEEHDSSESEFTRLIREYRMPPVPPAPDAGAAIVTPQPTRTYPQDAYVYASCTLSGRDKQTHVASGTPVTILWGWKANTAAQLQDYLDSDLTTVTLDGRDIAATAPYGIESSTPGNYKLLWFVQLGTSLTPGTHRIVFDEGWKKLIYDGTNTYGPGGQTESRHDECEIVVE